MGHTMKPDAVVGVADSRLGDDLDVDTDVVRRDITSDIFTLLFQMGESLKDRVQSAADDRGLGMAHVALLHSLRQPCRMGALASELGYDASHITAVVDRLEELGLVERLADPDDRRVRLINRTPAGLAVSEEMESELVDGDQVFVLLSVDECRQIRDLLQKGIDAYAATQPD